MSSDLHGVGIKLKTTLLIIVYNAINTHIMPELLTQDGMLQELFILFLELRYYGNYRFN